MGEGGFKSPEKSGWIRSNCIGKGSFGTVSIGISKSDGRIFAVKSVEKNCSLPAQVEAIENEIRILRSLSSPCVVKYYGDDVTAEGSAVYRNLQMEYVPGGVAADLAQSGDGGVDEEAVRACTWCVVSALKYVHSRGVVHCDVKGRNILVGPTAGAAKLADFGSAKQMIDGEANGVLPRGSPLWMAPEVVRGESQGFESDVWSLGCTVIEMVTGKPAWTDEGADTLCRIGYSDELPQLPNRLSELGRDFVEKCLRRDPSQRWSCDQLLQHPFLLSSPANRITDSSPRSILDWSNLDSPSSSEENSDSGEWEISAAERIGRLVTTPGANWESGGWVVSRSWRGDSDSCSITGDDKEVGTIREYLALNGSEEESRGTYLQNRSSTLANPVIDDDGGACGVRCGGWEPGLSSLNGLRNFDSAAAFGTERNLLTGIDGVVRCSTSVEGATKWLMCNRNMLQS
ncbi:hypothetical protein Nepgr_000200 [Nepenthes gracilis]|uniref:Protein kinase domain-containing protein n=1 Tax=Nepenthes gracilis TaxID=150966 RepID=A0AAD3P2S6_NEPGR|nr:hypothetical protein Nepgr_000200 [Nepenthes gracilis]